MPKPAILVLAPPSSLTTSLLHLLTSDSSSFSGRLILASSPAPSVNTSLANVPNLRPTTFDWRDVETWWGLFEKYGDQGSGGTAIGAVYIVPPPVGEGTSNPAEVVEDFVVLARKRGVRRFVLLSSEGEEEWRSQSRGMGSVQRYLKKLEGPGGVEWAVLRAQFLQQSFIDEPARINSIRGKNTIYSAAGEGRVAWVSADDVAAVAVRALTNKQPPNTEYMLLGPELLSYYDIADTLTKILHRTITHVAVSPWELENRHRELGVPATHAVALAAMDRLVKLGQRESTNSVALAVTGHAPKSFLDFALSAKGQWETPKEPRSAAA